MSIGAPSNLGTLLIQRLDAVLGTTVGQQANVVSGAGPQAVPQPGDLKNPDGIQNPVQRHPREAVDQAASQGQQRATVAKAAREMQLDNLLGRSATLHSATQSAPTTLGYAARIILALLNAYPQADRTIQARTPLVTDPASPTAPGGPATGPGSAPGGTGGPRPAGVPPSWAQLATALGQPGALPARLVQALTQSIQASGLFYESHLAQLATGKTTPQALRQEPQGQLPPGGTPGNQAAPSASASSHPQAAGPQATGPQAAAPAPTPAGTTDTSLQGGTAPASTSTASTATASNTAAPAPQPPVPGIDPQAQLLVRQQLEVLANQGFVWQGEAWPGAPIQWEVQRRDAHDAAPRDLEGDHWATRITLHLPALGEVQARMSLAGDQLVMRLTAPESAPRLNQEIEALRSRLLAQGLQASQLSVTTAPDEADPAEDADHDEVTAS